MFSHRDRGVLRVRRQRFNIIITSSVPFTPRKACVTQTFICVRIIMNWLYRRKSTRSCRHNDDNIIGTVKNVRTTTTTSAISLRNRHHIPVVFFFFIARDLCVGISNDIDIEWALGLFTGGVIIQQIRRAESFEFVFARKTTMGVLGISPFSTQKPE